ncbi:hypothetical protein HMI54_013074, partial [Coelomomyces lativittatus]
MLGEKTSPDFDEESLATLKEELADRVKKLEADSVRDARASTTGRDWNATAYAKILVSELTVPAEHKTIKPVDLGGAPFVSAGGDVGGPSGRCRGSRGRRRAAREDASFHFD